MCNLISELSPYFGIRRFVDYKLCTNSEIRRQIKDGYGEVFDL